MMNTIAISVSNIQVNFATKSVLKGISWQIKKGSITSLIGPNGCGKSTLLKVINGIIRSDLGEVQIDGKELQRYTTKELAQKIAFLPQVPEIPKDMTVEELVYCGRYPYQNWWKNTAEEDRKAVDYALKMTKTSHLRGQLVNSLSGGERQRTWIAMAIAQEPEILILDEPTTYLDINHQLEVLELLKQLNTEQGLTVVMVLHELNQAAQFSHLLGVIHEGYLVAQGSPKHVLTQELVRSVFGVEVQMDWEDSIPFMKVKGLVNR